MLSALAARFRGRGFVGPRYEGLAGKLRLAWQEIVIRREVVLIHDSGTMPPTAVEATALELVWLRDWAALSPWVADFAAEYSPNYLDRWQEPFAWGEELALVTRDGRAAGFGWIQLGTREGIACHYGRILEGEARILRVGVLPSHRRRGVNVMFYQAVLQSLSNRGIRRVYVDCNRDNTPSLRAQLRAGFRPLAEIDVWGRLAPGIVRWRQHFDKDYYARFGLNTCSGGLADGIGER